MTLAASPHHEARQPPGGPTSGRRLAILSFSSGWYDSRSMRIARSAVEAGWRVTVYARLEPGLPPIEERDGYRVVRVPADWRNLVGRPPRPVRSPSTPRAPDAGAAERAAADAGAADGGEADADGAASHRPTARRSLVRRLVPDMVRRWRRNLLTFPIRPLGWARALDAVAEPADVWHGMWAGSLPAVLRQRRRLGGRAIYDSRDVYLRSRDWARLEWPLRPLVAALERHWARQVDRVVTVNEPYAELLARQLRVPRPIVVLNCPESWSPPASPPDHLRRVTGIASGVPIALYAGQLISDRGIEQAMDAILLARRAVLVLMGFGPWQARLTALAASSPYLGLVHVVPAVAPSELVEWTASADVSVMAIQPTSDNHRYTTPQKLFESLAAGVPVVASDLPGMRAIVAGTAAGVLCDPTSPASIAAAIEELVSGSPEERADRRRRILDLAHERYSWQAQGRILFGLYDDLLSRPADRPASRDGAYPGPSERGASAAAGSEREAAGPPPAPGRSAS